MDDNFYSRDTLPDIEGSPEKDQGDIPENVGPYRIETLLNRTGMSSLYFATKPETKETLAIKVLSSKLLSNKDAIEDFVKEAEIIALADHPNIVKLYGHGEWEGGLYIAM